MISFLVVAQICSLAMATPCSSTISMYAVRLYATLLTCGYIQDENLDRKRFDFLALKKPTEVLNMMHLGYEFTERLSREETFQKVLVSKSTKPSVLNSL